MKYRQSEDKVDLNSTWSKQNPIPKREKFERNISKLLTTHYTRSERTFAKAIEQIFEDLEPEQ